MQTPHTNKQTYLWAQFILSRSLLSFQNSCKTYDNSPVFFATYFPVHSCLTCYNSQVCLRVCLFYPPGPFEWQWGMWHAFIVSGCRQTALCWDIAMLALALFHLWCSHSLKPRYNKNPCRWMFTSYLDMNWWFVLELSELFYMDRTIGILHFTRLSHARFVLFLLIKTWLYT